MLFPENIGKSLSIDETAISKDELYTLVTNKEAKGGKKSLVASVEGTKTADIVEVLKKISQTARDRVKEVTVDMAMGMIISISQAFRFATIVIDRFHVQKLITEAVQEIRLMARRQAMKEDSMAILLAKKEKRNYQETIYENGDTKKQLLARSHYLLFKSSADWTDRQQLRANILFNHFPEVKHAYNLSMMFRNWYETNDSKEEAKKNLQKWYDKVEQENIEQFTVVAQTIKAYEDNILNYFNNRSTNASAESFNAKLKGFRALVRGVRDVKFFLFRVAKLYG